jgi:hypothetical protein
MSMVEALRRKGNPVGYFLSSGEQQGFRKAGNIQRCLDAELAFYAIDRDYLQGARAEKRSASRTPSVVTSVDRD